MKISIKNSELLDHKSTIFLGTCIYLDRYDEIHLQQDYLSELLPERQGYKLMDSSSVTPESTGLDFDSLLLRSRMGIVVDCISKYVSHIIVDRECSKERLSLLKSIISSSKYRFEQRPHVVYSNWIYECIQHGTRMNEALFF